MRTAAPLRDIRVRTSDDFVDKDPGPPVVVSSAARMVAQMHNVQCQATPGCGFLMFAELPHSGLIDYSVGQWYNRTTKMHAPKKGLRVLIRRSFITMEQAQRMINQHGERNHDP